MVGAMNTGVQSEGRGKGVAAKSRFFLCSIRKDGILCPRFVSALRSGSGRRLGGRVYVSDNEVLSRLYS